MPRKPMPTQIAGGKTALATASTTATIVTLDSNFEFPTRVVTTPDPDASAVPRYTAPAMSQVFRVGATCDTPGKSLTVRVYWLDSEGNPFSSIVVQYQSGSTADWAGITCVGTSASGDPCWPLGGAKAVAVKADTVTGGTWMLNGAMA